MAEFPRLFFWLVLSLLLLTGCRGWIAVEVDSEPPGAMVFRADTGEFLGETPTQVLDLRVGRANLPLALRKVGYRSKTILVPGEPSYETPEEAREHLTRYRFVLDPRF
ncbi:MAG: hypothetical protein D6731_03535 [Planctomycetota bacterium]|nr:MAG: hypothetical protein D6731_03535 [Planctomycetota bacterium]